MVSAETLTIELLDIIFLIFGLIAFIISIMIYKKWDIKKSSQTQYRLEKLSFLNQTIIKYIFLIKLPLFLFFIYTLDKLSNVIIGAMCAVGVVNATEVGLYLMILKIVNIYLFAFWLVLNSLDLKKEDLPYTKLKYAFFIILYPLLFLEIALEVYMFNTIDISKLVSCCGTVFSSSSSSTISNLFAIPTPLLLTFFYGTFLFMFLFKRQRYIFGILNLAFIMIALISLILFFSTYVYELPTHHCPFCLLQKDYFYVGYIFYTLLFLGTFFGISYALFDIKRYQNLSLLFNFLYTLSVTAYPISFYFRNGVWL
jgi:hypothetical protein